MNVLALVLLPNCARADAGSRGYAPTAIRPHGGLRSACIGEPAYGAPAHARFARGTTLRYHASARKLRESASAARLAAYRGARDVDEFFALHPRPARVARGDLGWDLSTGLCLIPG